MSQSWCLCYYSLQVEEEDEEFVEEFLSKADPSILHFLIASGAHGDGRCNWAPAGHAGLG